MMASRILKLFTICSIFFISCNNDAANEKLCPVSIGDNTAKVYNTLGRPIQSSFESSPVNGCSGETLVLTYKSPLGYSDNIKIYLSKSDSTVCYISDGSN